MKTAKRLIPALLLCLVLLAGIHSAAYAETVASGTWGDLTWVLDETGTLTISGEGDMNGFTYNSTDAWRGNKEDIQSVVIQPGVTGIGEYAFRGCTSLTSVTIPSSVTGIGNNVFSGCSGLTSVTIPSSVTSIGGGAFEYCRGLTSVTIPEGVTSIGDYAFCDCYGLTSVTIPASVTGIDYSAFYGCSGLTSVTIPSSVTFIGDYAFNYCSSLEDAFYPGTEAQWADIAIGADNEALTNVVRFRHYAITIPESANGTVSTEKIGAPEGDTVMLTITPDAGYLLDTLTVKQGETEIPVTDNAFTMPAGDVTVTATFVETLASGTCGYNLTWVLDDAGTLTISGTGAMYDYYYDLYYEGIENERVSPWIENVENIQAVVIQPGVTSIGDYAFYYCYGLTSVTIPGSVTRIGDYAFYDRSGLTAVNISSLEAWCQIQFSNYKSNPLIIAHNLYINDSQITDLTIPSSVTSISDYAFNSCYGLTSVTIPEGVTSIGSYAFQGCSGLTSVTIPDSVTSIGDDAFYGCSGLTSVTIGNGVTSISSSAFDGCSSLNGIWVDENNTVYYSDAYGVLFSGNTIIRAPEGLQGEYVIPDGVTSIYSWAFENCRGLTSVTIPASVTSIGNGAFNRCSGLTSLTIPGSVTSIGNNAFFGCSGLTSLTIPEGVTSICTSAFSGCSSLTSVTIPDSVTSIGDYAFNGCSGLTSVTIPEGVTSIGMFTFSGCSGLTSVTIPSSVTGIGMDAFSGCSGLTSVTIPSSVTYIGEEAFSGCSGLTSVTIGNGVTSISSSAFDGCSGLTSVTIPDSVTSISNGAFYLCTRLTSVTIPEGVTGIGIYAFYGCNSLEDAFYPGTEAQWADITIRGYNNALTNVVRFRHYAITIPESANGTVSTEKIGAPEGDTVMLTITPDAGYLLDTLTVKQGETEIPVTDNAFTMPAGNVTVTATFVETLASGTWGDLTWVLDETGTLTISGEGDMNGFTYNSTDAWRGNKEDIQSVVIQPGVTGIGERAFYNCSGLTSVTIPASVTSIGSYAFQNCSGLTSVTIGNGVTSIGDYAFSECRGLTSVTIPEGVTSIGDYAFEFCTGLTSVTIPEGVTSIGNATFAYCSWLTSVTIPSSVTSIDYSAFYGCSGLEDAFYPGTEAQWADITIAANNEALTNVVRFRHTITIPETANGIVTAVVDGEESSVCFDTKTVTLTVTPDAGYLLDTLTVKQGETEILVTDNAFTMPAGDVTVTATFKEITYTVTYDANGGTGAPDSQTKYAGRDLALSDTEPEREEKLENFRIILNANGGSVTPSRVNATRYTDYSFSGWNTKADGSGTAYAPGGSYTAEESVTLYAQWEADTEDAPASLPTPTREGYTFLGWANSTGADYGETGYYMPEKNVTLFAIWGQPDFILPAALTEIDGEAFAGGAFTFVKLSDMTATIGSRAFANCPHLRYISIPAAAAKIAADAFDRVDGLIILGVPGSTAESYAERNGFGFLPIA